MERPGVGDQSDEGGLDDGELRRVEVEEGDWYGDLPQGACYGEGAYAEQ